MTFAEYVNYTPPPGMRDELLNGEIILSPSPKPRHQNICYRVHKLLENVVREEFAVRLDTTINLKGWDGEEGPRPDVFVIDQERWLTADQNDSYPIGSPQLVVEVKSPSNNWLEFEKKSALFLADGALAVWIIDPLEVCVTSFTQSGGTQYPKGTRVGIPRDISTHKYASIGVSEIFDGIVQ